MGARSITAAGLLLVACHPQAQKPTNRRTTELKKLAGEGIILNPEAFLRPQDQRAAERLNNGQSAPFPCTYEKMELGTPVSASLPTDQCYKMTKPQRWRGLWRDDFEGSRFCPAPAHECSDKTGGDHIWLSPSAPLAKEVGPPGGLYALEFFGRRTLYRGKYGHFGGSDFELIVDRLIAIKEIEAPPPEPTKAQTIAYFKKCEAEGTCWPNWSYINSMKE
jgi:hypothetical protein